jgi:hypothetical protein
MVHGIFMKNIHITEYRNILFHFDKFSSSFHIDVIIKAPAYTIIINNIHENIYFAVLKILTPTLSTVDDKSSLVQLAQLIVLLLSRTSGKLTIHAKLVIGIISQTKVIHKINILYIFFIIFC